MNEGRAHDLWINCPFGRVGDALWVRETLRTDDGEGFYYAAGAPGLLGAWCERPSVMNVACGRAPKGAISAWPRRGRPSIFLPRWASRLTLRITEIRVERLQNISYADCRAEGIVECDIPPDEYGPWRVGYMAGPDDGVSGLDVTPQESFAKLWDGINASRGYGWEINPWVWALQFEVLRKHVDDVLTAA